MVEFLGNACKLSELSIKRDEGRPVKEVEGKENSRRVNMTTVSKDERR